MPTTSFPPPGAGWVPPTSGPQSRREILQLRERNATAAAASKMQKTHEVATETIKPKESATQTSMNGEVRDVLALAGAPVDETPPVVVKAADVGLSVLTREESSSTTSDSTTSDSTTSDKSVSEVDNSISLESRKKPSRRMSRVLHKLTIVGKLAKAAGLDEQAKQIEEAFSPKHSQTESLMLLMNTKDGRKQINDFATKLDHEEVSVHFEFLNELHDLDVLIKEYNTPDHEKADRIREKFNSIVSKFVKCDDADRINIAYSEIESLKIVNPKNIYNVKELVKKFDTARGDVLRLLTEGQNGFFNSEQCRQLKDKYRIK